MESAVVRLIIKAPNQQIEDQVVNCEIDWTVARLKDHLSQVYPSKPKNSDQKLIYSGHLLKDATCLKDVLRNYENTNNNSFIVHLVCATNKNMKEKKVVNQISAYDTSNSNGISNPAVAAENRQDMTEDQIRESINMQPSAGQTFFTSGYYGQFNSQQIAWIQQAYTQYLSQYMQLMAAQGIQLPNNVPYIQAMNLDRNDPANGHTSNNINNNRDNDEQMRAGAQDAGDAANDDGEDNGFGLDRDWLESIFLLLRIIVLFSIVYFYSSPIRFLIVTFLGFAIHLYEQNNKVIHLSNRLERLVTLTTYQGGFLRVNPLAQGEDNNVRVENNNARPDNNQNQQNDAQAEAPAPQAAQAQQQAGQVTNTRPEARTNANEEHEAERPGALAFTWMFFSSFFASLIPDQPNVI